ncbi:hypothetical protein ACT453_61605, partial [Bacillus sp. D-CC]
ALYNKGKTIEMLVNYEPALQYFAEWWKQLIGEKLYHGLRYPANSPIPHAESSNVETASVLNTLKNFGLFVI